MGHFDNSLHTHDWSNKRLFHYLAALLGCVAWSVVMLQVKPRFNNKPSKLGKHDLLRNLPESRPRLSMAIGMVPLITLRFA